jgi:hypothetical protein
VADLAANVRRTRHDAFSSPLNFLVRQLLMLGLPSALVWIPGLWFLLRGDRDGPLRVFGFAYLALFAMMLTLGAKDYYLAPIYPLLFAAGGAFWSAVELRNHPRWKFALAALVTLGGLLAAPLALPILSPAGLLRYEEISGISNPRSQTGQAGRLPEHFGDEFGWREMVAAAARVYHGLPSEEREKAAILAKNYGEAGAIDFFGPALGLPHAISGHQNYWLWGPRDHTGAVIVALQYSREELLNLGCATVEDGPLVDNPYSMTEEHFRINLCRGLHPLLSDQWLELKRWN